MRVSNPADRAIDDVQLLIEFHIANEQLTAQDFIHYALHIIQYNNFYT